MHELADRLLSHLKAIWRYRWYAAGASWIIAAVGWTAVYMAPERYEASARVYVNTQSVLRPLLLGLAVQPNIDQMVTMMGRTLISRPNLEKVIEMANLAGGLKTPEDRERLIARLARELTIQSAGRENLYTIAYTDKNPQEAKQVVQSLLTLFVEGSLGDQRKDSDAALRFIDEQLDAYNKKLVAAESAVTEFRRKHMSLMAGDRRDYYTRLVEAQNALNAATLELKEAENGRDAIKRQLSSDTEFPSLLDDKTADPGGNPELEARIQALEQKLDGLRLTYTEQYPDLVATSRIIAQLKEQQKEEAKQRTRKPAPTAAQVRDPVRQQLTVSLTAAEVNVAAMKTRVAEYSKRYEDLRAAVNAVPQVDAEYTQLTRDYDVTKKNYENLLARRESAQISGDMESNAHGMDFRVVDPPQVPPMPKAPNRRLLMSVVLLLALGGGLGVAFLASEIRPTISDERRLREITGLQVLGTVALIRSDAQKAERSRGLMALLISYAGLLSAYAAVMLTLMLTTSRV
jgi:polysaccharide chain length determinant protein (PEP-CTERM system associated)